MFARRRRYLTLIPAVLIALFVGVSAASAAQANVTMANFAFGPATLTVNVGDTVTWTNNDTAPHNATATDGSFKTPDITQGQSASVTFSKAGTFAYTCTIHPRMMATVIVQAAGGAAPGLPNTGGGGMAGRAPLPWLALALAGLAACGLMALQLRRRIGAR